MECDRLKLVVLGHFFSFSLLKTKKKKIKKIKKMKKNCWRYHHFGHVYQTSQSYDIWLLRYRVRQTYFFVILGLFLFFHPLLIPKIKFWKNERNVLTYYPFTHMYHINKIIWLLQKKIIFCHFWSFFALLPH